MRFQCWAHRAKSCLQTLLISVMVCSASAATQAPEAVIVAEAKKIKGTSPVTLSVLYPDGSLPNLKPVAEQFTKDTSINIRLLKAEFNDINTKIMIDAMRRKTDFDIALPATYALPDLLATGVLLETSALAKKYEALVDYQPSLYSIGDSYQGKKYGYQTDGDALIMFYNKAWLDDPNEQANYMRTFGKPLATPESWKELDQLMAFFHRPEQGKYGGTLFRTGRHMAIEWWVRFLEHGVYPVDDKLRPNINNEAGVASLHQLIAASAHQHPSSKDNGPLENWKEYAEGRSFASIGWGGTQKYLRSQSSALKNNLTHTTTPGISFFGWGWSYVVSNYSRYQELAYLFTLYATLPKTSALAIKQPGFFDPFREEHYQDRDVIASYSKVFLETHLKAMQEAIPGFYLHGHERYFSILEEAISSAVNGYVTPKQALDYAAREWETLTDKLGRREQIAQWRFLKSQYPPQWQAN